MRRFDGKVVMVTGAGSGIGRATALRFASEGARVSASDVNAEGLAATMGMLDGATLPAGVTETSEIVGKVGMVNVRGNVQGILFNVTGGGPGSRQ